MAILTGPSSRNSGKAGTLKEFPHLITDPDILAAYNEDTLGITGDFDGVFRPRSEKEISEIIKACASENVPVTPQGLRSSLTGASICDRGVVLSLEKMNRILDIDLKNQKAVVEPGIIVSELKNQLEKEGFTYPPDPTSAGECTLGGNVATNASGSRALKYGSTIDWITGLRAVDGNGEIIHLRNISSEKLCAGFGALYRPVSLFVGSEGTLGVTTRIEIDLAPLPADFFIGIVFFPQMKHALDFTVEARKDPSYSPTSIEFLDDACLEIIRPESKGFAIPTETRVMLYFEQEFRDNEEKDSLLDHWFQLIEKHTNLSDDTQIAITGKQKKHLHDLRHLVPAKANEESTLATKTGGCKISTDWAVPYDRIHDLFHYFDEIKHLLGDIPVLRFAHIGNGHPHFNFIARTEKCN
jgi:glycolate oxidase